VKKITLIVFCIGILFIFTVSAWARDFKVQVLDATIKDKILDGAEVILQKIGETSQKSTTNNSGIALFANPFGGTDNDSITMIIKKDGFSNLVVKCPCNQLTYALSPVMTNLDGLRIVLTWGKEPKDLDAHLIFGKEHVYFSHKIGNGANLDVDNINSYGPETITIQKKQPIKYLYAVHNYSEECNPDILSLSNTSDAHVFVYVGSSLVRTFVPPKHKVGNVWMVFGIGENGEFYDINKFTSTGGRAAVGQELDEINKSGGFISAPEVTMDQKTRADELNKQGEKSYWKGKLQDAVDLYLEAINNNPEHGQAYSNLGLAYQKLNCNAEAIWANEKAIAIASGPNKTTIQASSHYNIARIYENQSRWDDALANYQAAQNLRNNEAYIKGIARMKKKLNM